MTTDLEQEKKRESREIRSADLKPALIVEDSEPVLEQLKMLCSKVGLPCIGIRDGAEAAERIAQEEFSIYILDHYLPNMDGHNLLIRILNKDPNAVIIMESSSTDPGLIVQIMEMNIYKFMTKPLDSSEMKDAIRGALEKKAAFDAKRRVGEENYMKAITKLNLEKENKPQKMHNTEAAQLNIVAHLRNSLSAAGGFGLMLTLLEVMSQQEPDSEGNCVIDQDTARILFDSAAIGRTTVYGLDKLLNACSQDAGPNTNETDMAEVLVILNRCREKLMTGRNLKDARLSPLQNYGERNCKLNLDLQLIEIAFREILLNCLKYSPEETEILLSASYPVFGGYAWLSFENEIDAKEYRAIKGRENELTEPFVRYHPLNDSYADLEEINIGLGMTFVDRTIRMHDGILKINLAERYTDSNPRYYLKMDILLPTMFHT